MSEYDKFIFGNNLRELRKANDLNQSELAKKIGVSQHTISQWENGVREPETIAVFLKLSEILNVSLDDLVKQNSHSSLFSNVEDARDFILRQPMIANFGGYDLERMSDEEIMEMAEEVSEMLKIMAKRHRTK